MGLLQRGYDEDWLGDTFSRAVLCGNGLVAILAGLLANLLVTTLDLGPVAPFDAALVLLAIGGGLIISTWRENYGESDSKKEAGILMQFSSAIECIRSDSRVLLLGVMQVHSLRSLSAWLRCTSATLHMSVAARVQQSHGICILH